ncbi:hypothetical protein ACFE04_031906 [Oxalis oulophora]
MALARLALRNLQQRSSTAVITPNTSSFSLNNVCERNVNQRPKWSEMLMNRFMATSAACETDVKTTEGSKEVSVTDSGKKFKGGLFRRKKGKRGGGLFNWGRRDQDFAPPLSEFFPSEFRNTLLQATENMNKLFESMNISPFQLSAQIKEQEDSYKLRYEMPGLSKEDVKITVDEDGVLTIVGEQKKEGGDSSSDDDNSHWSAYGYYNANIVLPEDAKVDEIKAELKDGLLTITLPRNEKKPKKDVKEVEIH